MSGARAAVLLLLAGVAAGVCPPIAPAVAQQSRCDAADALAGDSLLLTEAKAQYTKALNDPEERACAVTGLMEVAAAQAENRAAAAMKKAGEAEVKAAADKKKEEDDKRVTFDEAVDAVVDWAAKAWPWFAAFALLCALGWLWRLFFPAKRIAIRAAKADAKFAEAVVAAASTTGADSGASPSIKIVLGEGDALPDKTIADLSAVLALPKAVPIGALLRFAALPLAPSSLSVGWAVAGGWAVADLKLKRAWRRRRRARLALELGALTAADQQEAMALVAGAWIVGLVPHHRTIGQVLKGKPKLTVTTKRRDEMALLAHAYFRAGANLQQRGKPLTALRCYRAMPPVEAAVAPFAWVGARLNAMMQLKAEGRVDEAIAMAQAVDGVAHGLLDDPEQRERYGTAQLRDLRRRTVYLSAILRVDLVAVEPSKERRDAATSAVKLLVKEIQRASAPDAQVDLGLLTAMRMVRICHAALVPGAPSAPAEVARALKAGLLAAADASPCQPLGAAAYYDAACAYTLIATHNTGPTEETIKKALATLTLAAAATPASSRTRMVASAQSDAMLAALRTDARKAEFDAALGVIPEPETDAYLAVTLTEAEAAVA